MLLKELENFLFNLKGKLNIDEGIIYGSPNRRIKKICVAWMADLAAIRFAKVNKANAIICHEALFYPYP